MTFLQLCQRLRQEAGLTGSGPTTTVDQTGISKQVVDWINSAYVDIQSQHSNWSFMQSDFSFETVALQREYSIADTGVTDLESWKTNTDDTFRIYLTSSGVASEQYLFPLVWPIFRSTYLFGSARTASGLPSYYTVQPDKGLNFNLVPDAVYTVNGEYYKKPVELSGDADEPNFPSQFHMLIVWRALMYYAGFDAANEKYATGNYEAKKIMRRLEFDQLPQITYGAPLV